MSNNYTLECFIHYIHLSFFSLPSSRSLPFFFFNKEIMGDKLEEEEKKTLAIYDEVEKYIHIYIRVYFKTNIILREYCLKYFQMDVVKSIRGMTNGRSVFVKMMDS